MIPTKRMSVVATIGAATIAAVVGCSHAGTPTSSGTATPAPSTSADTRPAAVSAAPQAPPCPSEAAHPVDVTVAPDGDTTVRPGGPPTGFTVTLVNNGSDLPKVGMVVSLGHCSCCPPGASMMAMGTMHMLDPQTNAWVKVPYVREGTGMDYITVNLVPPFPLSHGQTATYQLEMQLDADQPFDVTNGQTAIDVTLTDPDDPMEGDRFGDGSYHPITVEV